MNQTITFKKVYTTKNKEQILILYTLSKRHFIGVPLNKEKVDNFKYIPSIDFYYNPKLVADYRYSDFSNGLYIKGKPVIINDNDFKRITKEVKHFYLDSLTSKTNPNTIENLLFDKWIIDQFDLNELENPTFNKDFIRVKAIYWVNFGVGVGSELRKLRPAILWRMTSDKNICTFIPISSKCFEDEKYFHYDLTTLTKSTAKIECMENLSSKRIVESYNLRGKPVYINKQDFEQINKKIIDYYVYHPNDNN